MKYIIFKSFSNYWEGTRRIKINFVSLTTIVIGILIINFSIRRLSIFFLLPHIILYHLIINIFYFLFWVSLIYIQNQENGIDNQKAFNLFIVMLSVFNILSPLGFVWLISLFTY